jgi:hypothetical protein
MRRPFPALGLDICTDHSHRLVSLVIKERRYKYSCHNVSQYNSKECDVRLCSGSIRSAMTTCSAAGTRCTLSASATSRARAMRVLARLLCRAGELRRSATRRGCSENLAPHATTVAISAGCSVSSALEAELFEYMDAYCGTFTFRRARKCVGLRNGRRVCTTWK